MQMVQVVDEKGKTYEWTVDQTQGNFTNLCFPANTIAGAGNCNHWAWIVKNNYCAAEVLLGLAGLTPSPISATLTDSQTQVSHTYTVPPQAAATNAAFASAAFGYFQLAMSQAIAGMDNFGGAPTGGCDATALAAKYQTDSQDPGELESTQKNLSAIFGSVFRDGYRAAVTANAGAITNTLAVSDAQQADAPSLQLALSRSYAGPQLSRSAAAHLLLGGVDGFMGDINQVQCSNSRLSGSARRALEIFRQAGVSPLDVMAPPTTTTTDELVNSSGSLSTGSVRERLAYFENISIPTNEAVWDFYGLNQHDFEQARQTLADEIKTFSRSATAKLTDNTGHQGTLPTYHEKYAATATPPSDRDPAYWMALTLTESADLSITTGGKGAWRPNQPTSTLAPNYLLNSTCGMDLYCGSYSKRIGTSLSQLVDYGHSWANYLLSLPGLHPSDPQIQATLQHDILAPLATLATGADRAGRLTQCSELGGGNSITAYGYAPTAGLILVPGDDNLECATRGNVEGAPCSISTKFMLHNSSPGYLFSQGAEEFFDTADLFPNGKTQRWYLLAPRQPGTAAPGLGGYKALAGFVPYLPPSGTGIQCRDIPIVPDAINSAAQALATSPEWCGQSAYECDGVRFDERLPLEDELTNDNDGVESSWKHYLSLAHTAANQADALGQAYLTAGQAVDNNAQMISLRQQSQQEKAAAELENLQSVCGTTVDTGALLKALGTTNGDGTLNQVVGSSCTPGSAPTSDGYECINGTRVLNWRKKLTSDPTLQPLADCLAGFDETTEVGLGDTPLCRKDGAVTLGDPLKTCDQGACDDGFECIPKEQSLGFFHSPSVYPTTPADVCDAVRVLRKTPGDASAMASLVNGKYFTAANVRELGEGTDVHLDYGGYVTVHVGGATYSTSSNGVWPCGAVKATNCGKGADGLFCKSWDCSNIDQRAEANERLYQAVLAAKLLTWQGLTTGKQGPIIETPALIYSTFAPSNPQMPGNTKIDGYTIDTWSNDRWRMFVPDHDLIAASSPARIALTIGAASARGPSWFGSPLLAQGSFLDVYQSHEYVAIERQPLDPGRLPATLTNFWSGMAPGAGAGYIKRVLTGEDWSIVPTLKIDLADDRGLPSSLGSPMDVSGSDDCQGMTWCETPQSCYRGCIWDNEVRDDFKVYGLAEGPFDFGVPGSYENGKWYVHGGESLITSFDVNADESKLAALDSLEMFCDGMNNSSDSIVPGGNCNGGHPPPLDSVGDLDNLGAYIECLGDDITRHMVTTLFGNVPTTVVTGLEHSGKTNTASGGDLDTAISNVREALDTIAASGPNIGGAVHRFGQDMRSLRAQLQTYDISDQIDDVQLDSTKANQITSCLSAAADVMSGFGIGSAVNPGAGPAAAIKTAITCSNSYAQITDAIKTDQLQKDENTAQRDRTLADFNGRFSDYVTTLQTQSGQLSTAIEHLYGALSTVETLKAKADRSVDNALWLLSEQAADQGEITSALSNINDGSRIRYERALSNAKKTAALARRAIEQRLGVSLNDMVEDLPLVSAPSTWASKVCTTSGIDFQALSSSGTATTDSTGHTISSQALTFADSFIGDYVDKLDQVVESYRLKNNFHEGTDTAIVSLRDDVDATRADCDVTSRNILLNASNLALSSTEEAGRVGWSVAGCTTQTATVGTDSVTTSLPNCVTVSRTSEAPFLETSIAPTPLVGYQLTFGNGTSTCTGCGWNSNVALQQNVDLASGRYRLSWYTKDSAAVTGFAAGSDSLQHYSTTPGTGTAGVVKSSAGNVLPAVDKLSGFVPGTHGDWNRAYFVFDVTSADTISVAFRAPGSGTFVTTVAAPMLERLDDPTGALSTFEPQSFADTGDTRTSRSAVCEDADGTVFREKKWQRGCVMLCPDGYASDCRDRALRECYWETSFNINQNGITTGSLFGASGFARGNFNYRIDTVGLNFVGTGLRNCTDSTLPTTCNAAGFVPYSIYHEGPYFVRNHKGEDFQSFLFTAAIEHARGLGTERYLTNPMSQADSQLLQPYLRQEFQGRPLDGDFVVRVWDADGLDFNALQDVQVVLNYRYWTRFN